MPDTYSAESKSNKESEKKLSEHFEDRDGVLVPIVPDTLHDEENGKTRQLSEVFDPEWYICQTSVSLIGKFYFKDELKVGEGEYGKYCSFSLRTKKLKRGVPWTSYFYVKVWGDDLVTLLQQLKNETFIKVVGDLEVYRNTTYIRAKTIIPLLNARQMIEEIKTKEALAIVNKDTEQLNEMQLAQKHLRSISDEVQKTIQQESGNGTGILQREEPDISAYIHGSKDEEEEQAMINKQKKKVDTGAVTGHDIEHLLLAMSGLENQGLPVEDTMSTIQKESPENTEEDEEDYLEDYLGDYLGDTEGEEDGGGIFDGEDIAQKMNDLIARSRQGNQEDEEEEEEDDINIVVLEDADKDDGTKTKNHFRTEDISQKKGAGTKKIQKIRRSAFTRPASQKRK
jgi:hypothetical protein